MKMILTVTTTDIAHGGWCVARHEGIVVFVSGALPGEKLEVEVTDQRKKMWYARTITVVEPSPDRVTHIWPEAAHSGVGGADLGHVALRAQREWKARIIENQMRRMAHIWAAPRVETAPIDEVNNGLNWRTRVTVKVDQAGHLGMNALKSHQILPITSMPLAHEEIQEALAIDASTTHEPGAVIRYVLASDTGLVVVHGATQQMVQEKVDTTYGSWVYDVAADGFWQVHRQAPPILVEAVLEAVGATDGPIVDLFSGAGLFSVPLADHLKVEVTAVESDRRGVEALRCNGSRYGVIAVNDDAIHHLWSSRPGTYSVIVCDPPRSGIGASGVEQLVDSQADKVVYVACDPAALARDVGFFLQGGYDLADLRAFDLFPMTHHVECVAVFTK